MKQGAQLGNRCRPRRQYSNVCRSKQPRGERVFTQRGACLAKQLKETSGPEKIEVRRVQAVLRIHSRFAFPQAHPAVLQSGLRVVVKRESTPRSSEPLQNASVYA